MTTTTTALAADDVVACAPGLRLLGRYEGSGYVEDRFLAVRGDGQTVMLTPLLHAVLSACGAGRDAAALAGRVGAAVGREVGPDVLAALVHGRLVPAGLAVVRPAGLDGTTADGAALTGAVVPGCAHSRKALRRAAASGGGTGSGLPTADPLLATTMRRPFMGVPLVRLLGGLLAPLFRPVVVSAVLALWLCGDLFLFDPHGLLAGMGEAFTTPGGILATLGLLLASTLFHELGHAAGCTYGGARPGAIGAGLYLWVPVFWTDVTDAYRLDRAGRLRTDLGGVYFNAVTIVAMTGVALATGWAPATAAAFLTHGVIVQQLLPIVRMDGYYLFGDLTGVPNLFAFTGPVLRGLLPGRRMPAQVRALRPGARAVVVGWVLVTVPALVLMLGWLAVSAPSIVRTSWEQVVRFRDDAFGARGVLDAVLACVCIVLVVLPLVGMAALAVRVVQRFAVRALRLLGRLLVAVLRLVRVDVTVTRRARPVKVAVVGCGRDARDGVHRLGEALGALVPAQAQAQALPGRPAALTTASSAVPAVPSVVLSAAAPVLPPAGPQPPAGLQPPAGTAVRLTAVALDTGPAAAGRRWPRTVRKVLHDADRAVVVVPATFDAAVTAVAAFDRLEASGRGGLVRGALVVLDDGVPAAGAAPVGLDRDVERHLAARCRGVVRVGAAADSWFPLASALAEDLPASGGRS